MKSETSKVAMKPLVISTPGALLLILRIIATTQAEIHSIQFNALSSWCWQNNIEPNQTMYIKQNTRKTKTPCSVV
jgi:hypothetical protein